MTAPNWIPDINRFFLAGPPKWWLDRLWEFDPSLVVVPSRQSFVYRIAQRRKLLLPEKMVHDLMKEDSDTKMLASYSLIPVTTIIATADWNNPLLFVELSKLAPWRHGGAEAFEKKVMEEEAEDERKKAEKIDDILTQVAKDGWGMYRKKAGFRTSMWTPRTPTPSRSGPLIKI